jgi:hypothetical protein
MNFLITMPASCQRKNPHQKRPSQYSNSEGLPTSIAQVMIAYVRISCLSTDMSSPQPPARG